MELKNTIIMKFDFRIELLRGINRQIIDFLIKNSGIFFEDFYDLERSGTNHFEAKKIVSDKILTFLNHPDLKKYSSTIVDFHAPLWELEPQENAFKYAISVIHLIVLSYYWKNIGGLEHYADYLYAIICNDWTVHELEDSILRFGSVTDDFPSYGEALERLKQGWTSSEIRNMKISLIP